MKNQLLERRENKGRDQIKDYVLVMLGAPVIKIEMDDNQLETCIQQAENLIEAYESEPTKGAVLTSKMKELFVREAALAYSKQCFGAILSRPQFNPNEKVLSINNGQILRQEGISEIETIKANLTWALDYPDA